MENEDWTRKAANEITSQWLSGVDHWKAEINSYITNSQKEFLSENIREIITRNCPFKPNVAYEEVKDPPLLICIDCKNTESPAGAMARYFNHGRCLHCGGYFKVVRA